MRRNTSVIIKSNQQFNLHIEDILLWCFYFVSRHFRRLTFFYYVTDIYGPGNVLNTAQSSRCFQRAIFTFRGEGGGGTEKMGRVNDYTVIHFHAEWLYCWSGKAPLTGGLISGRSRTSDGGITGITTVTMTCFANVAQRNIP